MIWDWDIFIICSFHKEYIFNFQIFHLIDKKTWQYNDGRISDWIMEILHLLFFYQGVYLSFSAFSFSWWKWNDVIISYLDMNILHFLSSSSCISIILSFSVQDGYLSFSLFFIIWISFIFCPISSFISLIFIFFNWLKRKKCKMVNSANLLYIFHFLPIHPIDKKNWYQIKIWTLFIFCVGEYSSFIVLSKLCMYNFLPFQLINRQTWQIKRWISFTF